MSPSAVAQALEALPQVCPDIRAWVVAYSGGRDSTALLHAAQAFAARHSHMLRAVHVNHGWQSAAEGFARHCEDVCRAWGIALACAQPRESDPKPDSEAAARALRYRALQQHAGAQEAILLAHHQDDQAETLLLQLLRGAGMPGTAAMPVCRDLGETKLVRPLLRVGREEIEKYVRDHQLPYLDDPSNQDLGFDRNFLRHEVLPLLESRWPSTSHVLARAARYHAQAADLLRERAEEDFGEEVGDQLSVESLAALSEDRQINLMRFWIARRGFAVPGERRMREWLRAVHSAGADRTPREIFEDYEIYRWRGQLHLVPRLPEVSPESRWRWRRGEALALPELGLRLRWEALQEQLQAEIDTDLEVRLRVGGERCRPRGRQHRHSLKKLLQEAGVPPWRRDRIPLVYQHAKLRLVWGFFECFP